MNTPLGLLGAGLCFWGWQADGLRAAIPLALGLEASRFLKPRWEVAASRFDRVADFCILAWLAMAVYLYATGDRVAAVMTAVAWIPVCYAPLLAAQVYSAAGKVDAGTLFLLLRRRRENGRSRFAFDLSYPFFGLCLFCAGAANRRAIGFYLGVCALILWALWAFRPRRVSAASWLLAAALVSVAGFAGQLGLHALQGAVEKKATELLFGTIKAGVDPFRTLTAIGRIGALQQSGEIALRVRAPDELRPPGLLREAAYNAYRDRQWYAKGLEFVLAPELGDAGSWKLAPSGPRERRLIVSRELENGEGLLALPEGAWRVEGLPALQVRRSGFGSVVARGAGTSVAYGVAYDPEASLDAPPIPADLELPAAEKALIKRVAGGLALGDLPPRERLAALARFFKDFRYSIYQQAADVGPKPLEDFLLRTRRGHCEYFATATVLLLRATGIPARYAVGFSIVEFNKWEDAWIARQRHGHAWAQTYVDGRWRDFDTTPATWVEIEDSRASWHEALRDRWSWLGRRFSLWRARPSIQRLEKPLAWAATLLLAILLIWKLRGAVVVSRGPRLDRAATARPRGLDSELYAVERRLAARGLGRYPWEAWTSWIDRIAPLEGAVKTALLREIVALHQRLRFDPKGLGAQERQELALRAKSWAAES